MHAAPSCCRLSDRLAGQIEAIVLHDTNRDLPFAVSEKLMELQFDGVPTYTLELFHEVIGAKSLWTA